jgi:hypothetical protein
MSDIPSIFFLNIRISVIDVSGVLRGIETLVGRPGCALVNNVNIHACNLACEQPEFRRILNASAIVFCDGYGVKWAARLRGLRLGKRMTPPDWVDALFELGARRGWSFFFVGDEPAVVETFAAQVRARHSGVAVAGTHHGFFQPGDAEDRALRARIRALSPRCDHHRHGHAAAGILGGRRAPRIGTRGHHRRRRPVPVVHRHGAPRAALDGRSRHGVAAPPRVPAGPEFPAVCRRDSSVSLARCSKRRAESIERGAEGGEDGRRRTEDGEVRALR